METSNKTTNLEALKQNAIEEIIEEAVKWKNMLYAEIQKKLLERYLTKDWNPWEELEDNFIENISQNLITDEIKTFKEDLNKVNNEVELNTIKTTVINSINNLQQTTDTTPTTSTAIETASRQRKTRRKSSQAQNTSTTSKEHYELDQFNIDVSKEYKELYNQLTWKEKPDLEPFACAMKCYEEQKWFIKNTKYLTVVDFTKPNTENRFYVIDMEDNSVKYATTVWHWQWSWTWKWATSFSNITGSNQSSLWFFTISSTYENNTTRTRRWLRMFWTDKDKKNNGKAASRWIFMHPWTNFSQWCFTLPKDKAQEIMEKVEGWALFAYAKSKDYFTQSEYFKTTSSWDVLAA